MKPQRGKGNTRRRRGSSPLRGASRRKRAAPGSRKGRGSSPSPAKPAQGAGAAGQATGWWVPWLAGCGAVLWFFMLANAAVPFVRCTAGWANKLLFLAAMLVPWYWLRVVRRLRRPRWRGTVALAAVAGGLAGPVLAWRSGTWTTERREISAVELPAGGRVVAREERSPGSLRPRMVARQERQFMPGVMVVRKLAEHPDAKGGLVELLDPDTVRIRPARVIGEVPASVRDLKPWAWW